MKGTRRSETPSNEDVFSTADTSLGGDGEHEEHHRRVAVRGLLTPSKDPKGTRKVVGKEFDETVKHLEGSILNLRYDLTHLEEEHSAALQAELRKLGGSIAEARVAADVRSNMVVEEASRLADGCNARTDQELQKLSDRLDGQIERLNKDCEGCVALDAAQGARLSAAEQRLNEGLERLAGELRERLAGLERRVEGLFSECQQRVDSTAQRLTAAISQKFGEASEAAKQELASASAAWEERDRAQSSKLGEAEARLAKGLGALELKLLDSAAEHRSLHREGQAEVFSALEKELSLQDGRLGCLEQEVQVLDLAVAAAANVPTRRIEWSLDGVLEKAFPAEAVASAPSFSWSSEDFDIAGVNGLRLELQHARSTGGREEKGDCSMLLWAPGGLFLIFKLIVGEHSVQVEHNFEEGVAFASDDFCFLEDQVNPDDGCLRIGIEVLEAVSRCSDTRVLRKRAASERHEPSEMSVKRYLNHRILALVQDKVESMTSRMVGRIEWRVEQASSLRRFFAEGESLCSSSFDAASLHGLQFVFYPLGYPGAREGYCSLFLYCPDSSLLKCWLSVGKVRKEVRISSDQQGYLGRTNFCRLDSCLEPDDSILLSLEIVEAQGSSSEALVHKVPAETPKNAKMGQLQPSSRPCEERQSQASEAAISSVMRLQQTPANRVLEDVRQLPSIWTPASPGGLADSLEGFHPFNSMKSVRRPVSTRPASTAISETEPRVPRTPRLPSARRYDMYVK